MSLFLVQYNVHSVTLDGSRIGGVQTVNVSKSFDTTNLVKGGSPVDIKNFYKKPTLNISFTKFISDGHGSVISGFNIADELYKQPPDSKILEIGIVGGGGIKFKDVVFGGITYNFTNEGFFTEELNYIGHISEVTSSISQPANEEGEIKRRQDFNKSVAIPSDVAGSVLLSVTASLNINYGEIPTFGKFYTIKNKYISYPVDISCTYEVLDVGYVQPRSDYSVQGGDNIINDEVSYTTINIGGVPSINLGTKNILTNVDRSGGDAGSPNYSIYKFTYKNTDNSFIVS